MASVEASVEMKLDEETMDLLRSIKKTLESSDSSMRDIEKRIQKIEDFLQLD